jgi:hypothetical protein
MWRSRLETLRFSKEDEVTDDDGKRFMRTLLALMMTTVALMGDETTNGPTPLSVTTNYLRAHKSFRRVDGQLYNIEKSVLWHDLVGSCATVSTNGIVVRTFVEKSETYSIPPSDSGTSISNILAGGRPSAPSVQTRKWAEEGPVILLVNYDGPEPTTGMVLRTKAIKVGTATYEGEAIEKWDCGTPNIVPVVVTNPPASHPKTNRQSSPPPVAK